MVEEAMHHIFIDMVGSRFERVASMGPHDNDAVLFRTQMAPGRSVPLHSHVDPECFYVLGGEIEVFIVGGMSTWRALGAGQSALISDGAKHAVRNRGDEAADLIVATDGRLARYFETAGRLVTPDANPVPPSPEDFRRLTQVAGEFGYWLATPEESAAITG